MNNKEIDQLKAENSRLAAVNAAMRHVCGEVISPLRPRWRHTMELAAKAVAMNPETALRDLLAPTIELLEEIDNYTFMMGAKKFNASIQNELARLRAITK